MVDMLTLLVRLRVGFSIGSKVFQSYISNNQHKSLQIHVLLFEMKLN